MVGTAEKRGEERVQAGLRVSLGSSVGLTRDVSASGLYFEIEGSFAAGEAITLAVEIDTAAGKIALWCHGKVVRVEQRGREQGVAVQILDSMLRADAVPLAAAQR